MNEWREYIEKKKEEFGFYKLPNVEEKPPEHLWIRNIGSLVRFIIYSIIIIGEVIFICELVKHLFEK